MFENLMDWELFSQEASTLLVEATKRLGGALVVFIVGLIIIRLVRRGLRRLVAKRDWDPTLESFLVSAVMAVLNITWIITMVIIMGVPASAFFALLGSAGLAIGLALQGSLSNIAGGVLLLVLRPLRVGDFVETESSMGTVESINLFYTRITTPDGQVLHLPNGKLANNKILNFSQKETRRVTIKVGISYTDDVEEARRTLIELVKLDARILDEPAPAVVVSELGDSAVQLILWVWVKKEHFGDVLFSLRESTKSALQDHGISIPFPQHEVHLYQK
ncbi:MAG TPA: mechanosensitive ion channel protein [Cytophagales bacterium]|nr:mechanosensitive ion channel protein [Cytophagales bacterium]HAP63275.1 mechanosensitive ion channel protein [Cytophagales bacterium]